MIAQSQSGTGKTAAFVIAMLSRVDTTKNYPQILCLSPTYELAIQTGEVAAKIAQFSPIKLRYAVRGEESKYIRWNKNKKCSDWHHLICFWIMCLCFDSCSWSKIGRPHHHRYTRKGTRLVQQIPCIRYKEDQRIRTRRSRRDDCNTRPPRPVYSNPQVSILHWAEP